MSLETLKKYSLLTNDLTFSYALKLHRQSINRYLKEIKEYEDSTLYDQFELICLQKLKELNYCPFPNM